MKCICLASILLFCVHCFAQIKIDKKVKAEFYQFSKGLPQNVSNKRNIESMKSNILLISNWSHDTLNKYDYRPNTTLVGIIPAFILDSLKETKRENNNSFQTNGKVYDYWVQSCHSMYSGDTLIVHSVYDPTGGTDLTLKVIDGKVIAIYKYIIQSEKTGNNEALVNANATVQNFVLDKLPTKNKTLFGKADILTEKFNMPAEDFRKGYRTTKDKISFLFTTTVK